MEEKKSTRMSAEEMKRLGDYILANPHMPTGQVAAELGVKPYIVTNWKSRHSAEMCAAMGEKVPGRPAAQEQPEAQPEAQPEVRAEASEADDLRRQLQARTEEYNALALDYDKLLGEKAEMRCVIKALTEEKRALGEDKLALVKAREILTEQVEALIRDNNELKQSIAAAAPAGLTAAQKLMIYIAERHLREEGVEL